MVFLLDNYCTRTLGSLFDYRREEFGSVVNNSSVSRALYDFHFTVKRVSLNPAARNSEKNIKAREHFAHETYNLLLDKPHKVYVELMNTYNILKLIN